MIKFLKCSIFLASFSYLSACTVHPLPEDSTGFNTVQIVAKVRCEVRDSIRNYVRKFLLIPEEGDPNPRRYGQLVRELGYDDSKWRKLRALLGVYKVSATKMAVLERYNDSAIAYEFIFNITENNKHEGGFDLMRNISHGVVSAGASGSATLIRNNYRTFKSTDNFESLVTLFGSEYCGPESENGTEPVDRQIENIVYPVVGGLNLNELIGAFLDLNESGNLGGLPEAAGNEVLLPTISDKMQFTTTFAGGGTLGFAGDADSRRSLRLARASISTSNSREDIHTLRMIIKLPVKTEVRTRTIAEKRLETVGVPFSRQASTKQLVKDVALVDLAMAPDKEYLEEKIIVARNLRILLPD